MTNDDQELTLRQAADILGLAPATLRQQAIKGRIEATRHDTPRGPVWLVTRGEVERYREENLGRHGNRR